METGTGGWPLHVVCVVCKTEAVFRGVLITLAADLAVRHGWDVDRDALHAAAFDRYATCPSHTRQ